MYLPDQVIQAGNPFHFGLIYIRQLYNARSPKQGLLQYQSIYFYCLAVES